MKIDFDRKKDRMRASANFSGDVGALLQSLAA